MRKQRERMPRGGVQTYLPTVELVLYQAGGEWRFAISVFESSYRAITGEGCLGDDRRRAVRRAHVLADRLGLTRVETKSTYLWRRLVPTQEF